MAIHREGKIPLRYALLSFIFLTGISFLLFSLAFSLFLTIGSGVLCLFLLQFFRNPTRVVVPNDRLVISPADGKVVVIEEVVESEYFQGKRRQLSIFMSPFNVHVNRAPTRGIVKDVRYFPGKYLMAMKDKASEDNERNAVIMECDEGKTRIAFVQIAGFIARRILCYVKAGDKLEKGERFGIIRFGSRVDVYLPESMDIQIKMGEVVKAGETVLAKFPSPVPSPHRGEGGGEG